MVRDITNPFNAKVLYNTYRDVETWKAMTCDVIFTRESQQDTERVITLRIFFFENRDIFTVPRDQQINKY